MTGIGKRSIEEADRVCFFAHYHHLGLAAGHTLYYLDALRVAGFAVVVMSTATMNDTQAALLADHCDELIFRENVGLDFGGWMEALRRYPDLTADLLLLANDSVYGPITDLGAFVSDLTAVAADFYGATESYQISPHLQSWFVLLRPSAYRTPAFQAFMSRYLDPKLPKEELIASFEVGLTRVLRDAGLIHHAAFSPARGGPLGKKVAYNPSLLLWRQLIEQSGVPFLKIELMRYDPIAIRTRGDTYAVVRRLNPRLYDLILEDQAIRVPQLTRTGLRGWVGSLFNGDLKGNWREFQKVFIADLDAARPGWRKAITHLRFELLHFIGERSRIMAKKVRRRPG